MIQLYPVPKSYQIKNEEKKMIAAAVYTEKAEWQAHGELLSELLERTTYTTLTVGKKGGVELCYDPKVRADGYVIDIEESLKIYASAKEGLLYGISTALQLLFNAKTEEGLLLESLHVEDYPDKEYRSLMVDLGREWHSFDKLLKYVDLCFLYKIKYLQLHFIDHKLFTFPSKAFPKLNIEGRYYTAEQIKQLNEYAAVRGIVLVPEFECPGHATPLNKAYPEVFSNHGEGDRAEIYNESGVLIDHRSLICAGSEKAFEGVKTLLDEMAELFPDAPYIHIGGDEAPYECWNYCTDCQEYMKKNDIADAGDLYCEYVGRVAEYVFSLGKTPIVWEGFPKSGTHRIPKDTVVIAWESHYQMPYELLEGGFRIINASWQPLYIVSHLKYRWNYKDILAWNVYNWQHWWQHSEATLNPITVQPTEQLLGAMLCVWEQSYDEEISHAIENLLALSERVWSVRRVRTDEEFAEGYQKISLLAGKLLVD